MNVTLRNVSSSVLTFDETFPEWDYKVELFDSTHKSHALTEQGKTIPVDWPGRWAYPFKRSRKNPGPGETVDAKIDLSDIYVIQNPGTYSVRVSRKLPPVGDQPSMSVESNVVTFIVE